MTTDQKATLLQFGREFLEHPVIINEGAEEPREVFEQRRLAGIEALKPLVADFVAGRINLQKFKEKHEFECREHPYWGFKGFSGQMQLNQFANNIEAGDKEAVLRKALIVPKTEAEAKEKIDSLVSYIAEKRNTATNVRSLPRLASVVYVLSYFWEIQENCRWPVFYLSDKKVLGPMGIDFGEQESEGEGYLRFASLIREIGTLYAENLRAQINYPFWFVEHVLWSRFMKWTAPIGGADPVPLPPALALGKTLAKRTQTQIANEWLPPIISDLNDLAFNKETEWSQRNGLNPEKAFESKLRTAFTLLGYETTELGQGTGRQPDGVALSMNVPQDANYALVYDAKATKDQFTVGTSDRAIEDYIRRKSDELKRQRVSRLSFVIVSSQFDEGPRNLARLKEVYRRTRVPIVMITAIDLLFLIEQKLQAVELDHTRLEQLFVETGILRRETMIDILEIR